MARMLARRGFLAGLVLAPLPLHAQEGGYIDFLFAPVQGGREARDPSALPADRVTRQRIPYPSQEVPGTILIDTRTRRLYLIEPDGFAQSYEVGVGAEGFGWSGTEIISAKREWPDWRPPAQMRARRPDLPAFVPGGPENPMGARALYLGQTLYRIHGSNEPETVGDAASSGCFRMTNADVIDLYNRARIGARVRVF
ncbi:L,D-transpeptidase [Paracoccus onubensis]|uniref:L,D-transpeptidase n=1 Tax=Paracoccus onubensis TaxID=1675788 RepID=A0A418T8P0_9RHOB|nr:L,D-transpeptidase [Paracoccus onubensis]RJE89496.1 L,D-transpeptidase [Paracoccus onubensis]